MADFSSLVDEAKSVEKKAIEYSAYEGEIELRRELDLAPKEFAEYDYTDLLNLYERAEKIIKASGMEIYGAPVAPPKVKKEMAAKTEEVESRVKEITGEALKSAQVIGEELEKKPIEEKVEEKAPSEKPTEEIEFERISPEEFEFEGLAEEEEEIELEREEPELHKEIEIEEKKPEIEIEKPKEAKPEIEIEKPEEKVVEKPPEEKPIPPVKPAKAVVPPLLRERAERAGSRKFEEIEEQIMSSMGEKVDEASLKKKMLELTKELFKTKSVERRERIKVEITVLKNMLKKKVKAPKKGKEAAEARGRLLDTLVSTQMRELAATKDKILTNYKHHVEEFKTQFQDTVSGLPEDDEGGRKKAYESMVFELTRLSEQLPQNVLKYQKYVRDKHETEIRKLQGSLDTKEDKLRKMAAERLDTIEGEYAKEFSSARAIVKKQIDTVIETTSGMAFKAQKVPKKKAKVQELIREVNDTDEGTLLYFLHGKDPEFYKKYERKHLSKQEAIFKAKALMAKEKGLSDDMISKYFSDTEG
jgi:hypothetical protein